jgi:hypothetical protein
MPLRDHTRPARALSGLLAALLGTVIAPLPADAAWSPTGEPVSTGAQTQINPAIASDGAGGSVVVFQDRRAGNYDIYAQRMGAAGAPLWTANGEPVCTATADQQNPGIVGDGAGGAFVFWEDRRAGFASDIYAQYLDATGAPQWTADGAPVVVFSQIQQTPVGISDGAGGVIIAWADRRISNYDIYVQRLDATGAPQWTLNGVNICSATAAQQSPVIIADGAGGAWVAWQDSRGGGGGGVNHYYAQRVNAAGTPQYTANGIPICVASGFRSGLDLSPAPSGGVVLGWRDSRNGLGEIFLQYVDGTGAPQWAVDGISVATTSNSTVSLTADGAFQYLVWDDTRPVTETDIYAQRIDATGATVWGADAPVCTVPGSQLDPVAATDASGNLVISWRDNRGPATDIFAQKLDAAGAAQWAADGVPLCAFPNFRQSLAMALGSSDEILATWTDWRDGLDIYAQRLDTASPPGAITVDQTGDAGAGSLRQALLDANATPELDRIAFAIPGAGPHVIQPASPLPVITAPVVIDGYSQTGSAINNKQAGAPGAATILVEIDGSIAGGVGLDVTAAGTTFRGLAVRGFPGSGIRITGADGSAVEGCHIGTDGVGETGYGNGGDGVEAISASGIHVGSQGLGGRNVIVANTGDGVRLTDVTGARIAGNHIGVDDSVYALGNGGAGVRVAGTSSDVKVGLTAAQPSSNLPIPIGGNAIRHNGDDGIRIEETVTPPIMLSGNGVDQNGGLGIDTAEDGVTGASVAPSFTAAPVLTRALFSSNDNLDVDGTVTGPPSTTVTVQVFSSDACDGSGSGEGARFIAYFNQALDGAGMASFSRSIFISEPQAGPAVPGDQMTGIVIVPDGPTSEHSACIPLNNTGTGTGSMVSLTDPATGTDADLTFDEVTADGVTTIEITDTAPAVPAGFEVGDPPVFYDISTTATFTGNVEVCIRYNEATIGIPEMDLALLHYDTGTMMWEDVTTTIDIVSNIICGNVTSLSPFVVARMTTTDVGDGAVPARLAFGPATPNPLRTSTSFVLEMPADDLVDVRVYDIHGRAVHTLASGVFAAGRHVLHWRGEGHAGERLNPGIYFARATVGGRTFVRRVIRLR